ncbi:MAG TPA: hypothetical protein VFG19_02780 [Geobacteraceae bacterium]|nr:hypothetical protein [Geobacteraceae bacterium]
MPKMTETSHGQRFVGRPGETAITVGKLSLISSSIPVKDREDVAL